MLSISDNPLFTIVMPSYLGHYKNAAKDRVRKFHRAVQSALNQSLSNYELFIIADGCRPTFETVLNDYTNNVRIRCSLIDKQPYMSGNVRNLGIAKARGKYIVYLDTDDFIGSHHLERILDGIAGSDTASYNWWWFDDYVLDMKLKKATVEMDETNLFKRRLCNINGRSRCGTSNICHTKDVSTLWTNGTYLHDWEFINALKKSGNGVKITAGDYYVCHIPTIYDI